MNENPKSPAVSRLRRIFKRGLQGVVVLAVLALAGFFVLPAVVKSVLISQIGKATHRPVAIGKVDINLYAMTVSIEGFTMGERDGPGVFAAFDRLFLDMDATPLIHGAWMFREIRLEKPHVNVIHQAGGRYNFSDLIDEYFAVPASTEPAPSFSLNNIQLIGGTLEFDDRPVDEKHLITDIRLLLPAISNTPSAIDIFVEPEFSAQINGSPLLFKGKSKPFAESRESEFAIELDDVRLARYLDYSPVKLPVTVRSGALDTRLKLVFTQSTKAQASLILSGLVTFKDVDVDNLNGAPHGSFRRLDIGVRSADVIAGRIDIEQVLLDTPELFARVNGDGQLDWLELLSKLTRDQTASSPVDAGSPPPVAWSLDEARISSGALRWHDESNGKPFDASVEAINVTVRNLSSQGQTPAEFDLEWKVLAEDLLNVDRFSVRGGQFNPLRREVVLADVQSQGVRGSMRRLPDGSIDWIKPPIVRNVASAPKDPAPPWRIQIGKYAGDDVALVVEDRTRSPAITHSVESLTVVAENLTTDPGQSIRLSSRFKLNRKAEVSIDGTVVPQPLAADLKLDVKSLELLPFQPYFEDQLNVAITRGQLTVRGDLKVQQDDDPNPANSIPRLSGGFSGQATIGDFQAINKLDSTDFLRWKSLYFGKIDLRFEPGAVSIGEIALSDFFARVIVSPEGQINLLQVANKGTSDVNGAQTDTAQGIPPRPADPPPATETVAGNRPPASGKSDPAPVFPVKVGKITLQGGSVRFSDNFIKPNYSANLRQIGGSIVGLSSEPESTAAVDLRGSYDDVAPLNIKARINPLSAIPYLDLQADIRGVELTTLSAYSAKYAGYAIDKGKLSLFVNYKIEKGELTAENRVFLDQLTFGEAVDSPDATKLPVTLAVALLKNSRGEIDINLPITGSLNDPQFSVGGLIGKVIVNLLVKAISSPFTLIASIFGGGEELSFAEFEYGRFSVSPETEKRLGSLAKALIDRPGLRLDIEGTVDPESDREGLKTARLEDKIAAAKRDDLVKKGVESASVGAINVAPDEMPVLLERVYLAEKFPKPRNMVGLIKSLPPAEMEKLILTNTMVSDDDLRELGELRAKTVRDWLIDHAVSPERLFLLPPRLVEREKGDSPSEPVERYSRVVFSLK